MLQQSYVNNCKQNHKYNTMVFVIAQLLIILIFSKSILICKNLIFLYFTSILIGLMLIKLSHESFNLTSQVLSILIKSQYISQYLK